MGFYEVWVRSPQYRKTEALTYESADSLVPGAIVEVPLQRQQVLGFVVGSVTKPRFETKPIIQALPLPALPAQSLALAQWLLTYYPAPVGVLTQLFLPRQLKIRAAVESAAASGAARIINLPPLTAAQTQALKEMAEPDTYILHGQTGSGKTRLYIELALTQLKAGKSSIILSPEISLTSQLARRFIEVFGNQVVILHSQLTPVERERVWLQILHATEPLIVIGPRSALFCPIKDIGLLVLDESHETSYKQEQAPYYQAGRVASELARLQHATLVFGSATPSISDYFLATKLNKKIVQLSGLATGREAGITTTLVDFKDRSHFPRGGHISDTMLAAVKDSFSKGEQSLLYLNRRGTARMVMCENCGWQALCPRCDIPLTYHADSFKLHCHSCSYATNTPSSCPECSHPSILFKTVGTKAIVEEIQRLLPEARVARFDTDNKKAERFEQLYDSVVNGEVDILVGTQLLAKGLDLPKLSTVGVILADTSLYVPDFTAEERTYQLMTQIIGRVGRGHRDGHAVIQTYHPENAVLRDVLNGDWDGFLQQQLKEREMFMFPPYCYLLKLVCARKSSKTAEANAIKLKDAIEASEAHVRVEGPAPSMHEKAAGTYHWQLIVKARDRRELLKVLPLLHGKAGWTYDIDPINLL